MYRIGLGVVLCGGLLLGQADIFIGNIALAPVTGYPPAEDLAGLVQPVEAGDGERHALFHGAAGGDAGLVHKAHAPQGVHRFRQHSAAIVRGDVGRGHVDIALAVDHADALRAALHILGDVLHLRAAYQGTQLLPFFVIYRGGGPGGGHIARRRVRHSGAELPPYHISQGTQGDEAEDDDDHRRTAAAFFLSFR